MQNHNLVLIKVQNTDPPSSASTPLTVVNQNRFIDLLYKFNQLDAVENDHAPHTVEKYDLMARNFARFLATQDLSNCGPEVIKIPLIREFMHWMKTKRKITSKTHVAKHVLRVRKALTYAVELETIPYNPLADFKAKRDREKDIINLNSDEFSIWINHKWHLALYQKAQDNYIMQMSAGLSYMDLFKYKTVYDSKNRLWIESYRGKNKNPFFVPLFHPEFAHALRIHQKHKGKLPYIENHLYNRMIREMAAMLGIDKYLTTHTGRKTFATLKDENGWSTAGISRMLGNTEKVVVNHYVNKNKKKVEYELEQRA